MVMTTKGEAEIQKEQSNKPLHKTKMSEKQQEIGDFKYIHEEMIIAKA